MSPFSDSYMESINRAAEKRVHAEWMQVGVLPESQPLRAYVAHISPEGLPAIRVPINAVNLDSAREEAATRAKELSYGRKHTLIVRSA